MSCAREGRRTAVRRGTSSHVPNPICALLFLDRPCTFPKMDINIRRTIADACAHAPLHICMLHVHVSVKGMGCGQAELWAALRDALRCRLADLVGSPRTWRVRSPNEQHA